MKKVSILFEGWELKKRSKSRCFFKDGNISLEFETFLLVWMKVEKQQKNLTVNGKFVVFVV